MVETGSGGGGGVTDSLGETVSSWILTSCQPHSNGEATRKLPTFISVRQPRTHSHFYNAVICSIIVYGSVCWDGNISKFDRGCLEMIVKKKKSRSCYGNAIGQF